MHISNNLSHWVCIFSGLFLILTGLVSHVHQQRASNLAEPVQSAPPETEGGTFKRVVLVGIGLVAVAYGVMRVLP